MMGESYLKNYPVVLTVLKSAVTRKLEKYHFKFYLIRDTYNLSVLLLQSVIRRHVGRLFLAVLMVNQVANLV